MKNKAHKSSQNQSLIVQAIPTEIFRPGMSIIDFIDNHINQHHQDESEPEAHRSIIQEGLILAVTSKIISLAEGRTRAQKDVQSKTDLILQEADHDLGEGGHGCRLTIKHGIFIASSGIDESNSENGDYILYPEKPFESLEQIWLELKKRWGLKNLGLIMTDSHTAPLRKGVTGLALAHWGFHGLQKKQGQPDLFGRELRMTNINAADALAAAAVLLMGEADESCPLAFIQGAQVEFVDRVESDELRIPLEEDLYYPLFK